MDKNYFRYTGQTCPVCGRAFGENNDIVVCPVCGAPHHRDCYKQQGECACNDRHGEGFRWEPEKAAGENPGQGGIPFEDEGKTQDSGYGQNPYAGQTGAGDYSGQVPPFFRPADPFSLFPEEVAEEVTTREAADFVQMSAIRYIQKFFYRKEGRKTFNWAAFIFSPYWFFFRKLYRAGALFLAFILVISLGLSALPQSRAFTADMNDFSSKYSSFTGSQLSSSAETLNEMRSDFTAVFKENRAGAAILAVQALLILALHIVSGIAADKLYYDKTVKKVRAIKGETAEPLLRKQRFFREGGVSAAVTVAVLFGVEALSFMLSLLL